MTSSLHEPRAPRRLAILTPTFGRGGSEDYVIAMARWARAQGHEVTVCLPAVPALDPVRRDLDRHGIRTDIIVAFPEPVFSIIQFLESRAQATTLLAKGRFDRLVIVLPSIEFGGPFIDAAAAADIPTAVIYQLIGWPYHFTHFEKVFYTWARRQRQVWAAVSAQNREVLCRSLGWATDALEVIPNALLRPYLPPSVAERVAARASV